MGKRLWRNTFLVVSLGAVLLGAIAGPVVAKQAEPPIATRAWYWEDAQSQEFKDPLGQTYTVETPNPFCPGVPGQLGAPEQTCAEGRLPIEIHDGDYETPNKMSAINFDLSLVPVGSKVSKFTVTFLEAKQGCYDNADEDEDPNWCEETNPVNIDGKQLQACKIGAFFGDGDSRPSKEAPKYECASTDPTAKRKEVKGKGDEVDHTWTFDLTPFAQEWITEFTTNTSIMLVGKPPKGYKPGDTDGQDNWRVVLTGAKAPEGKNGVVTKIVFDPAEIVIEPPTTTTTGGTGGTTTTTGGTGTVTTGGTGSFDTGGTGGFTGDAGGGTTAPTDTGTETGAPVAVGGAETTSQGLPVYVWLALLGGVALWSVFRSVVLESAKGTRPDGVLAQIHQINAERNGATAAAAAATGPSAFSSFIGGIGHGISSLVGKLRLTRKG